MKILNDNTNILRYLVFWAGAFLVIFIIFSIARRLDYQLAKDGIEANGVITSVGPNGDYTRTQSGLMSYEFRSADGALHKITTHGGDMLVDLSSGDPNAPRPPYQTTVIYLKDNPEVNQIKYGEKTVYLFFRKVILFALVFSLVFLILRIVGDRRRRNLRAV